MNELTGIERIAERIDASTKWGVIKNGDGKVTGYIELFWGGDLGWVSIPGASRVIAAGSEIPS